MKSDTITQYWELFWHHLTSEGDGRIALGQKELMGLAFFSGASWEFTMITSDRFQNVPEEEAQKELQAMEIEIHQQIDQTMNDFHEVKKLLFGDDVPKMEKIEV